MRRYPGRAPATSAAAAAGALAATAGALGLGVAVAGTTGPGGYVSEAGVPGAPHATLYRLSIFGVAVALLLLGVALRPVAGLAAAALGVAAGCTGVSGAVTCTPGCPLPPYQATTPADLVHAGASILAGALTAGVVLLLARAAVAPALRRVSRLGSFVAVPLLAATGVSIVALGRTPLTALSERASLAALSGWLVAASLVQARPLVPGHRRSYPLRRDPRSAPITETRSSTSITPPAASPAASRIELCRTSRTTENQTSATSPMATRATAPAPERDPPSSATGRPGGGTPAGGLTAASPEGSRGITVSTGWGIPQGGTTGADQVPARRPNIRTVVPTVVVFQSATASPCSRFTQPFEPSAPLCRYVPVSWNP